MQTVQSKVEKDWFMKIRHLKVNSLLVSSGLSLQQLAELIADENMSATVALDGLKNWLVGRDHPRLRTKTIEKIAKSLGSEVREIARFTSEVRYHRGSPRKARLVADLIRGKSVDQALSLLSFSPKRASLNLKKALDAAVADAELNQADITSLIVAESRVDEGPRMKRFQPKDRGRAHPIIKSMSHITIGVEEKN